MSKLYDMQLTDLELVRLAKKGSEESFERLVERYEKKVMSLAMRFSRNQDDAKDIFQEVFIRAYRGIKKFEERSQFSTWLFRIATNVSLTFVTKKGKNKMVSISENSDDDEENYKPEVVIPASDNSEKLVEGNEIKSRVNNAIENLSSQEKIVFTLRHFEELKLKEIAEIMNCAEGTVKKYLFTATRKMRVSLSDLTI